MNNLNRFEAFKKAFQYNDVILNNPLCWHVWKVAWNTIKSMDQEIQNNKTEESK